MRAGRSVDQSLDLPLSLFGGYHPYGGNDRFQNRSKLMSIYADMGKLRSLGLIIIDALSTGVIMKRRQLQTNAC
jgi:hypothetical protein